MTETFSDASSTWTARAAQLLGWAPDTFWAATPSELIASLTSINQPQDQSITRDQIAHLIESENDG